MLTLKSLWPRRSATDAPSREAPNDAQERRLLAAVARGGLSEFEALYRLYHPRLQRFLWPMLRQSDLAEEVLNDTLLVVWQRAGDFDGRSKLSTWIFGIAYRKALKGLSRQDLPQESDETDEPVCPQPGPEARLSQAQSQRQLQAALAELSWEHRAVVELCYFQDMAYAEIAEVVGCPAETVKTRMFYARKRLRRLLDTLAEPGDPS